MPKIFPYKAVRASNLKVKSVVSRSYETYSKKELKSILENNPDSFLHILRPGYSKSKLFKGKRRSEMIKERYLEFKKKKVLNTDNDASLYIYKVIKDDTVFCGILATVSVEDYRTNKIKKHEDTLQAREDLFKEYLKVVHFNAEPVLLTYTDNEIIKGILDNLMNNIPEYTFETDNSTKHFLWKMSDSKKIEQLQKEFEKIDSFYIADGHHRSASSYLLAEELKNENANHAGTEAYNFFLSYLIPESNLKIHEYNRLIKDLDGLTENEFLDLVAKDFIIHKRDNQFKLPENKGSFGMYLKDVFYILKPKKHLLNKIDSIDKLDAQILYKSILNPILNIKNLRNNNRIEYIHGKESIYKMKELIDNGSFSVGFSLMPVSVSEIKKIADGGHTMPPKSTYIEPKLLSALTIFEF